MVSLDNLIERGYKILSSHRKEKPDSNNDLFFMLKDKEHGIIGSVVVMGDFSVHFEGCNGDVEPVAVTSQELEEILKQTHSITVELVDRNDLFGSIDEMIKRIK